MKNSMQLKAKIKNLSHEKRVAHEIILRNYMLERLLERISLSKYKDNFILKGGILIAAMLGIDARSTLDMDATIRGQNLSKKQIKEIFEDIINVKIDDNVSMKLIKIEDIREEAEYPGLRISIETVLDKTKQTLQIDVTTGDIITPEEINYSFKLMFEDRKIVIKAYNIETVLSEKLETIIVRSTTNTRMRDFYDIYTLLSDESCSFVERDFINAIKRTSSKRGSLEILKSEGDTALANVFKDSDIKNLWKIYTKKYSYAKNIEWDAINKSLMFLWNLCKDFL